MFSRETYIDRRQRLKSHLTAGIVLILGNRESPGSYQANSYKFRQDSSFLYFFGIDLPDLAGVIDLDEDREYLFGDDVSLEDIIWSGPQLTLKENAEKAGVSASAPHDQLVLFIKKALSEGRRIHFLPPYRADNMLWLEKLLGIPALQTKQSASVDLIKAVIELRLVKEDQEIAEMEKACDVSYQMHTTAMRLARPGVYEREIAGAIEGIALASGGTVSFQVILSKHGEILHTYYHGNLLQAGDLLLVDAGCETSLHYDSDITRVTPVGGKFSTKQREIYEIVLLANNNTLRSAKPGVRYRDLHLQAATIIASGLKDLGLMKGSIDSIVEQGAHALFFPHGLGHAIGLDDHDMESLGQEYVGYDEETHRLNQFGTAYLRFGRRLQSRMTMTSEPGIYFIPALIDQWRSTKKFSEFINYDKVNEYRAFGGVRIEDEFVVTDEGNRLLGARRVPVTIKDVEEMAAL